MKVLILTADANTLVYHRGDLIREVDAGIDLSDLDRLRVDEAGVG